MNPKDQIEQLKASGRSKGSVALELGINPKSLSRLIRTGKFSKLQAEKIAQIYEREINQRGTPPERTS